ncbi:MAG: hemolysin family protein [Treponema sp.]|jgi:putative hemolysin|nr:hemolysin family protein [Treponema sp.]
MMWSVIALACLIAASAFFSASETAFLSITRITLQHLQKSGDSASLRVWRLRRHLDSLLSTILVGNNLVNNFASSIAAALAISLAGSSGVVIASAMMTVLIVLFGEILPKTAAAYYPLETAKKTAPPLSAMKTLLLPVVFVFTGFTKGINRLLNIRKSASPLITEEELKTLIDLGSQEGTVEQGEREMLKRIFEFTDLRAEDIMRHRSLVKAIPRNASYSEMIGAFTSSGYSLLPVYDGAPDNYIGLVYYKDVLFYRGRSKAGCLRVCMRKLRFIPGTMPAVTLLHTFKAEGTGFAVVVNEHGGNSGIVTTDDVLNAVLGRIAGGSAAQDQQDADGIRILSPWEFSVPGGLKLAEFNGIFSFAFDSDWYDTLAGWLLERFDALPQAGECLRTESCVFTIEEQENRRIQRVRVCLAQK